ncbi:P7 [Emaravirus idaeobati]|uniref:p7 n=1 Tax=Emaravirus idaeobati TaxID=1980431 RepID=A0A0K1LHL2_9VIRU|nr:P7 [Emaravirus idaeobati]AKU41977.1 P7 [Emaravirus idaeobati]
MSSINKIIMGVWSELFDELSKHISWREVNEIRDIKEQLMNGVSVDSLTVKNHNLLYKLNKLLYLCTQIVDYDSIIYSKLKVYLDLFDISIVNRDFNLRHRNLKDLSRLIATVIDINHERLNTILWERKLEAIANRMNENCQENEINLISKCENYLSVINNLEKTISNINSVMERHNKSVNDNNEIE